MLFQFIKYLDLKYLIFVLPQFTIPKTYHQQSLTYSLTSTSLALGTDVCKKTQNF